MAYSQHEWVNGEIITAEKLNNIEQGIADCGSREIEASATATVENTSGEPSVEVAAEGSVSSIAFGFAFKGIKGERGEAGIAPLLKKEDGALLVSCDNGESWEELVSLEEIRGEQGASAPMVTACELNIAGTAVTGKLSLSDGSSVDITGTYIAESGDEESPDSGGEEEEGGDNSDSGGNGSAGGADGGEAVEGEAEPEGGNGETPEEGGEEE